MPLNGIEMTADSHKPSIYPEIIKNAYEGEYLESSDTPFGVSISVKSQRILEILEQCRSNEDLNFTFLTDLTAVDYLKMDASGRFAVIYVLKNLEKMETLIIKAFLLEEELAIDSVSNIWKSAEWLEREVWDLFGIRFNNHPNLKRILLPDDYEGHPLRKDYPLKGRGERDSFKIIQRERERY